MLNIYFLLLTVCTYLHLDRAALVVRDIHRLVMADNATSLNRTNVGIAANSVQN